MSIPVSVSLESGTACRFPELLADLRARLGPEPIALSTVSVIELEHGVWRAKNAAQSEQRRNFLNDLFAAVPCHPLTFEIARRAARVDGEAKRRGVVIPFQDLVIGATALAFDYAVATHNIRHFRMIPDLLVKEV